MGDKPYVKILEEPVSREGRFRYDSEGRFAEIFGANSTEDQKTYPTIEIMNHTGPACVVVSCVTKDEPYMPHPHNLVGKSPGISQGICYFKIPAGQSIVSFSNIGIQRVKKKDIVQSLAERQRLAVDPFKTGYQHKDKIDKIDVTAVRLCFQVFLEGQGSFNIPLDPVVSEPIYDNKKKLRIFWRSHYSVSVSGGTAVCLLCEKISKDDIQIRFFDNNTQWEAIAEFTPPRYHRQHALIFKTPKYTVQDINQPIEVYLQLRRPSDGELSAPVPFQFIPEEYASEDGFRAKRQKYHETPRDLVFKYKPDIYDQNANADVSTSAFPVVKTDEPWDLSAYTPNVVEEYKPFSSYKQMNMYISDQPSTSNAMATNINYASYNEQPRTQRFNQMTQNYMMQNNGSMQHTMNSCMYNTNHDQQYLANANEQRNQENHSYLDELLTTMDQNN